MTEMVHNFMPIFRMSVLSYPVNPVDCLDHADEAHSHEEADGATCKLDRIGLYP